MNKRVSLNLIGQISSVFVSLCISFIVTPYVVNKLGAEVYGFVGLANNMTSYITLVTVALNGMLSRYITIEYCKQDFKNASGYFSTAFITQLLLAVGLLVPMMLFAGNFEKFVNISPQIVPDVRVLWILMFISFIVSIPFGTFGVSTFVKNRLEIAAIISIISNILRMSILIVTFLFYTPHVWYIGLATIVSNIFALMVNVIIKKHLMPEVEISLRYFDFRYIYNLVVVGVWNSLNKLQQLLYSGFDLLLTNLFINGTEMGLLSIAKTIPTQITTLIGTVSGTFDPSMTIAYGKGDRDEFLQQTELAMKISGFLCSVPIMGFMCFGRNFYNLWMPSLADYEVMKIHLLAIITMFPQIFSVYIYPLYTINTITCKLKVPVLVSLGIGVVNIIIVLLLLNFTELGVYAVAGVSSILWIIRIFTFVPLYAANNVGVKWTTFYKPLLKGVINVFVLFFVFSGISLMFSGNSWLSFAAICGVVAIIGYAVSFMIIFGKEKKKFVDVFKNNLSINRRNK